MKKKIFNSGIHYNLFYDKKDYLKEAEYINKKLKENNVSGNSLLELGCGTGKHALNLTKMGYKILGIDQSQEMIDAAQKNENFKCINGDIRNLNLNKKFDSIISLFHVISYQITNKSLNAVFKTAYDHLNDHGLFLFDAWFAPAVINLKPDVRVKTISNKSNTITRIAEPEMILNNNQVNVKYTFYDVNNSSGKLRVTEEIHQMRFFSIPELEYIANQIGFQLLEVEEFLTSNEPSLETWGVCFILKKI